MCRRRGNDQNDNENNYNSTTTGLSEEFNRTWNELANKPWDEVFESANRTWDRTLDKMTSSFNEWADKDSPSWKAWYGKGHRHHHYQEIAPLPEGLECTDTAYPAPSARQHNRCVDNAGVGVWDRQGLWNCLVPQHAGALDGLNLDVNHNEPLENKTWFKDYTVYLDWNWAMKNAVRAQREQERQQWRQRHHDWHAAYHSSSDESTANPASLTDNVVDPTKYVTEADAVAAGKKVESVQVNSDVAFKDGSLQVKKVTKKWYDDGTLSISETISGQDFKDAQKGVETVLSNTNSKGGWFWK